LVLSLLLVVLAVRVVLVVAVPLFLVAEVHSRPPPPRLAAPPLPLAYQTRNAFDAMLWDNTPTEHGRQALEMHALQCGYDWMLLSPPQW
jgi:hypothetical protein